MKINKNELKKAFLERFKDYEEIKLNNEKFNCKNFIFLIDLEHYKQVTIEFIYKNGITIYVNADSKEENDFIIDYFRNLKLDKQFYIADRLNNIDYAVKNGIYYGLEG